MAFDGAGNFSRDYNFTQDRDNGIKIMATRMDGEFDNFAAGMNVVFFRNGLVAMSGDLNMGINRIVSLGDGSAVNPAIKFSTDPNSGLYLSGYGKVAFGTAGAKRLEISDTGAAVTGVLSTTGNATVGGTLVVTGAITASSLLLTNDLAVADGGTGASDAANARTNLGISATNTPFTATGGIAATNVQAALAELDTEKAALTGAAFTGNVSTTGQMRATGGGNMVRINADATRGYLYSIDTADVFAKPLTILGESLTFNSGGNVATMSSIGAWAMPNGLAVTGTLSSTGNVTLGDATTDSHTLNGTVIVTNGLAVTGTLSSTGNVTLGDATTDSHTLNGAVSVTNGLTVTGGMNASAAITAGNNLVSNAGVGVASAVILASDGATLGGARLERGAGNGFVSFYSPTTVRQGYIGFQSGTRLQMVAEGSATGWAVTGDMTISNGLGVTGAISASTRSSAATLAGTGYVAGAVPAAELGYSAGKGFIQAYNGGTSTILPLRIIGTPVTIDPAGVTVGTYSATGLAITGTLSATGAITQGGNQVWHSGNFNPDLKAGYASPIFTGTPAAPTAAEGTNTTQIATTAFIDRVRDVKQSAKAAAFQFDLTQRGAHVYYTGAAAAATIPANATVAFPTGTAITIVNDGSGVVTLTRAGGVALKWAGTGANANRALAIGGVATLLKVAADTWYVSGAGLS